MQVLEPGTAGDDAGRRLADTQTPLIRNAWYVAALGSEVSRTPANRRILNQDVLLYRTGAGEPVALQNRCAHRGFPLHRGQLNGDRIVCPYHGLEYGPDGRCAYAPSLDAPRPTLTLQRYPVVERGPFIWIWMGEADRADAASLPDHAWMTAPDWEVLHGSLALHASYVRMHENLMDLSHFAFLHGAHGVGTLEFARRDFSVSTTGDQVCSAWSIEVPQVTELRMKHTALYGRRARREDETWFFGPGAHVGRGVFIDLDAAGDETTHYETRLYHLLTPESQTSTRYYWIAGFDAPFPPGGREGFLAKSQSVFQEDADAVNAIEALAAWEDRPDYHEASIPSDRAGLTVRRRLSELARREQAQGTPHDR